MDQRWDPEPNLTKALQEYLLVTPRTSHRHITIPHPTKNEVETPRGPKALNLGDPRNVDAARWFLNNGCDVDLVMLACKKRPSFQCRGHAAPHCRDVYAMQVSGSLKMFATPKPSGNVTAVFWDQNCVHL